MRRPQNLEEISHFLTLLGNVKTIRNFVTFSERLNFIDQRRCFELYGNKSIRALEFSKRYGWSTVGHSKSAISNAFIYWIVQFILDVFINEVNFNSTFSIIHFKHSDKLIFVCSYWIEYQVPWQNYSPFYPPIFK